MCCAVLTAFGLGPRIAVLLVWIFGDRVEFAFDSWIWPLLGLIFLPWTTLAYLIAWDPAGVDFWEWLLILAGFALDVASYSARAASKRYQQPAY